MDVTNIIGIISIIIQLMFLEGILSIDNAAVLGAMVVKLPNDKPVPYPKQLHFLQHFTDKRLGMQRMAALKVGLLGAYAGRGLMLVLAAWVIQNPILKLIGALYLMKLAFEQLSGSHDNSEEEFVDQHDSRMFWMVVLNIELADLAFSLDNVVAAVALSSHLWIVMIGVALGIVTMRFAAGIFSKLIAKEPILSIAAYLVVLNIGIELLLAEFLHLHFEAWQKFAISIATILVCLVYDHVPALHFLEPLFKGLAKLMGYLNSFADTLLKPVGMIFHLIWKLLRFIAKPLVKTYNAIRVDAV